MNRNQIISIALFTGVALAAGYWWGHTTGTRGHESPSVTSTGGTTDAAEGSGSAVQARRILYYRNPMGLNDTSPVPKKDAMGMDYIPVYDGDVPDGPQVKNSLNRLQTLGVKTEAAASRSMSRTIRAVGTIEASGEMPSSPGRPRKPARAASDSGLGREPRRNGRSSA